MSILIFDPILTYFKRMIFAIFTRFEELNSQFWIKSEFQHCSILDFGQI